MFSIIPPYEFDTNIAKRVAPLTVVYVLMLAFNNLCLQYVEVTFYQVARSLSIHFSILFTYIILGKKTSTAAIGACAIVFLGFVIGSYGEINFSWEGLLYGVGSSAFVALYGIFVQKSLAVVDNNQWRLLHYNTTLAIMILFPLMLLSGELSEIRENVQFFDEFGFWLLMVRKDRRCEYAKTLPGRLFCFNMPDNYCCIRIWNQYCHVFASQIYFCLDQHYFRHC